MTEDFPTVNDSRAQKIREKAAMSPEERAVDHIKFLLEYICEPGLKGDGQLIGAEEAKVLIKEVEAARHAGINLNLIPNFDERLAIIVREAPLATVRYSLTLAEQYNTQNSDEMIVSANWYWRARLDLQKYGAKIESATVSKIQERLTAVAQSIGVNEAIPIDIGVDTGATNEATRARVDAPESLSWAEWEAPASTEYQARLERLGQMKSRTAEAMASAREQLSALKERYQRMVGAAFANFSRLPKNSPTTKEFKKKISSTEDAVTDRFTTMEGKLAEVQNELTALLDTVDAGSVIMKNLQEAYNEVWGLVRVIDQGLDGVRDNLYQLHVTLGNIPLYAHTLTTSH